MLIRRLLLRLVRLEQERALEVQARDFMERRAKARMGKARAKANPTWPTSNATDVVSMATMFGIVLRTEASNP